MAFLGYDISLKRIWEGDIVQWQSVYLTVQGSRCPSLVPKSIQLEWHPSLHWVAGGEGQGQVLGARWQKLLSGKSGCGERQLSVWLISRLCSEIWICSCFEFRLQHIPVEKTGRQLDIPTGERGDGSHWMFTSSHQRWLETRAERHTGLKALERISAEHQG